MKQINKVFRTSLGDCFLSRTPCGRRPPPPRRDVPCPASPSQVPRSRTRWYLKSFGISWGLRCSGTLGVSLAALGPLAVTKQVATTYLLVFPFSAATREEERKPEGSSRRSRSRRWRRRRQGRRRKRTEDRVLHESCGTCHELPKQKRSFFKQVIVLDEEARTCSSKAVLGGLWGVRGGLWEGLGGSGAAFGEVQGGLWGAPGRF